MAYGDEPYPYSAVAYITVQTLFSSYQGSGVLISPDEVLTASHLTYDSVFGPRTRIEVSPGYNGGSTQNAIAGTYAHYNTINDAFGITFTESQRDFSVIHLAKPVPGAGTFALLPNYNGGGVDFAGYPQSGAGRLVTSTETVSLKSGYTLLQGQDQGPGSSGGPIWVDRGGPAVVGLVSSRDTAGNSYNVQLTSSAVQQIQAWVHQDDFTLPPVFDTAYYDTANPDVAAAPESAAFHYDTFGWHEGRDPDAYFSTSGYLGANPDVRAAKIDPLLHYATNGWKEGRDPGANFDTTLYLLHNPDVAAARVDPLQHFLQYGRAEGRAAYAAIGPAAQIHQGFDPGYYLLANPDVARAGADPWQHFLTHGWKEGRNPDAFFNTSYYLANNPDVARAGVNPLLHYDQFGWKEGRDPSSGFSTRQYLAHYGDIAAARIDPLEHYLQFGARELRATFGG